MQHAIEVTFGKNPGLVQTNHSFSHHTSTRTGKTALDFSSKTTSLAFWEASQESNMEANPPKVLYWHIQPPKSSKDPFLQNCQWRAEISTNKENRAESWRVQMSVWCNRLTNPHSSISTKRAKPKTCLAKATAREGSQNKRQFRADYSASNDIPTKLNEFKSDCHRHILPSFAWMHWNKLFWNVIPLSLFKGALGCWAWNNSDCKMAIDTKKGSSSERNKLL